MSNAKSKEERVLTALDELEVGINRCWGVIAPESTRALLVLVDDLRSGLSELRALDVALTAIRAGESDALVKEGAGHFPAAGQDRIVRVSLRPDGMEIVSAGADELDALRKEAASLRATLVDGRDERDQLQEKLSRVRRENWRLRGLLPDPPVWCRNLKHLEVPLRERRAPEMPLFALSVESVLLELAYVEPHFNWGDEIEEADFLGEAEEMGMEAGDGTDKHWD